MLKPHLNRYWLNANPKNPETFKQESNQICQLYQQAQALSTNNIHIISTDEMTKRNCELRIGLIVHSQSHLFGSF